MVADPVAEAPPTPGQEGADSIRGQKQGWLCSFGGLPLHDPLLPAWPYLLIWFTTPQSVPQVGDQRIQTHEPVENIAHINPSTVFSLSSLPYSSCPSRVSLDSEAFILFCLWY